MKNIKIFPKDWLQLHPYKQSTPVDSYYTGIANRIYDIMEKIGQEFDPGDYEDYSVMGYVFYRLNRAPVRGDKIRCGGVDITVKTVKGRRAVECVFVDNGTAHHSGESSE